MHRFRHIRTILLLALLAALLGSACGRKPAVSTPDPVDPPASPAAATPTPNTASAHPRLFFRADSLPALRAAAASTHRDIWQPIEQYAASLQGSTPPQSPPDDLDSFRNSGNRLLPLAFACAVGEDSAICETATAYLLALATWPEWGQDGERSLALAHMLMGTAIAYDWLAPHLTPDERDTVRAAIGEHAHELHEASIVLYDDEWNNWWTHSYLQNHYHVIYSALGMAGLALHGEDERAEEWLRRATERLARAHDFLEGIGDGTWHEGIPYQSYGMSMLVPFLVSLRTVQGTDLLPHTYLQNYAMWRLYNLLPDGTFVMAYGDFAWDWGDNSAPMLLRFVAAEYDHGYAEWTAQQLIAADPLSADEWMTPWAVFEFLFYNPEVAATPPDALPRARVFPDLASVIWRTGWDDDALVFGFKTGAYGGRFAYNTFVAEAKPWEAPCYESDCQLNIGHDHDDMQGFYLVRGSHWLAPENEGIDKFDTALHNTLLIDGGGQQRPSDANYGQEPADFIDTDASLQQAISTDGFSYLAADATHRYPHDLTGALRAVLFVRPDYLVMLDRITAESPHTPTWVSHFGSGVSVDDNAGTRWVRGDAEGNQMLGVAVAAPADAVIETGNDGRPFVHVQTAAPTDDARMLHVLVPMDGDNGDDSTWDARPQIELRDDSGAAMLLHVAHQDGTSEEIIMAYVPPERGVAAGDYICDGNAAVVARGADGSLARIFVAGGTGLRQQRQFFADNLPRAGALDAHYEGNGNSVHVSAVGSASDVRLLAPAARNLTVNGAPAQFTRDGDMIVFIVGE